MMLSNRDQSHSALASAPERVFLELRLDGTSVQHLEMEHTELLVGRGGCCDLRFEDPGFPLVHSEFRRQGGVLWVETVDSDLKVSVNNQPYTRLALRDGDRVQFGDREIVIHIGLTDLLSQITEDVPDTGLRDLSAEELCDLILAEQQEFAEYEDRKLQGWHDLIAALDSVLSVEDEAPVIPSPMTSRMLAELQRIEQTIASRRVTEVEGQSPQEIDFADSRLPRLNELLEQLQGSDLRASA